jgi:DNA-binding transcriptional MerR regulator
MISIGELSRRCGVHIETIRYYERTGVLPKARRAANGRRIYGSDDAARLSYIRHGRELGFDLQSVRQLLALQQTPDMSCEAASKLASARLADVESRLHRLTALRDDLKRMVRACRNGRVMDCRIIEALSRTS